MPTMNEMLDRLADDDFDNVIQLVESGEYDDLAAWLWPLLRGSYERLSATVVRRTYYGRLENQ